jgi:hypothetical protein
MGLPFNVYWYKVVVCVCVCVFDRHIKTTMRPSQPAALSSHCVSVKLSARDLFGENMYLIIVSLVSAFDY